MEAAVDEKRFKALVGALEVDPDRAAVGLGRRQKLFAAAAQAAVGLEAGDPNHGGEAITRPAPLALWIAAEQAPRGRLRERWSRSVTGRRTDRPCT
jgi:hypothetical protein